MHAYNAAEKISKYKITKYNGNFLYFTDSLDSTSGRGYGTSDDNKLTSVTVVDGKYTTTTTHSAHPGMEEYYCTLDDFIKGSHTSSHTGKNENSDEYRTLSLSNDWQKDDNKVYYNENPDVIAAFVLFTAPTWLDLGTSHENYIKYTKVSVEVNKDDSLEMKLWVSSTEVGETEETGKLDKKITEISADGKHAVFSRAVIHDSNIEKIKDVVVELEKLGKTDVDYDIDLEQLSKDMYYDFPGINLEWLLDGTAITTLEYTKPSADTTVEVEVSITLGKQTSTTTVSFGMKKFVPTSGPIDKTYTFSNFKAGTQYADGEVHVLDENVTVTTTDCHFTTELRIYSSSTNNGNAVIYAGGKVFTTIGFNAGNKADTLSVYGSKDGSTWTLIKDVSVVATYKDYTVTISETSGYTYIKLDVKGSNQVRVKTLTVVAK